MCARGKYKGSANLPEDKHIDVRQEIANVAGVCSRNVSNVKTILKMAHPLLLEALQSSELKISGAIRFCKLSRAEQLEQFSRYSEERATNKGIHRSIPQPKEKKASLDFVAVLDALQQQEARQPGSVAVRIFQFEQVVREVRDDGCGIPAERLVRLREASVETGVGLAGIRERMHSPRSLLISHSQTFQ